MNWQASTGVQVSMHSADCRYDVGLHNLTNCMSTMHCLSSSVSRCGVHQTQGSWFSQSFFISLTFTHDLNGVDGDMCSLKTLIESELAALSKIPPRAYCWTIYLFLEIEMDGDVIRVILVWISRIKELTSTDLVRAWASCNRISRDMAFCSAACSPSRRASASA